MCPSNENLGRLRREEGHDGCERDSDENEDGTLRLERKRVSIVVDRKFGKVSKRTRHATLYPTPGLP